MDLSAVDLSAVDLSAVDLSAAYERSWELGRDALRNGGLRFERPPGSDDSGRWGVSVLLWPDPATARRLSSLANELSVVCGPRRWAHDERSLHFTVRMMERYREPIAEHDERIRLYRDAVARAAAGGKPVRLHLLGLTLAPNGVLVCGVPVDGTAGELRERLRKALSRRGVPTLPAEDRRDMWHSTLLHYTGPPDDPDALIRWVGERRGLDLGQIVLDRMALCRTAYDGRTVRPSPLLTVALGH